MFIEKNETTGHIISNHFKLCLSSFYKKTENFYWTRNFLFNPIYSVIFILDFLYSSKNGVLFINILFGWDNNNACTGKKEEIKVVIISKI
jgi:hypothetical protein